MKLSMNLVRAAENDRESLRWMKKVGFDGIDFSFCVDQNDREKFLSEEYRQERLALGKLIREEGLEIPQCHLPYLSGDRQLRGIPYEEFEEYYFPMYVRCFEICQEIGCPVAVIHLYFSKDPDETYEGNLRLMKKLLPFLERYDVTLAIENIFGGGEKYTNCFVTYPEEILRYVSEMNHPKIGICLDTGHAGIFLLNPVAMAKEYGSRLVATHIHGNGGEDEHILPGLVPSWLDFTDYYALAETLREIGYKGCFNLEVGFSTLPKIAQKAFVQLAHDAAYGYVNP